MPLGANKAAIMGVAGVSVEDLALLDSQTASADATISFTGISSTYSHYMFGIYNANPATNAARMCFQVDDAGGDNGYNDFNITTSIPRAIHYENNAAAFLAVNTAFDQAEATTFVNLGEGVGNLADEHFNGVLHLFNPSSTTYVKHFFCRALEHADSDAPIDFYTGGYVNTTTALNAIQFKFTSGNIDTGTFKMWGAK